MSDLIKANQLFNPQKLWKRDEALKRGDGVPRENGIYAWYFKKVPKNVPCKACIKLNDFTLLYLGIAPVGELSNNTIRSRLRSHFKGNASSSTLRLSLGCLLAIELNLKLQKTGRTERLTFGVGENALTEWMNENCRITWMLHEAPWEIENKLLLKAYFPLNIKGNSRNTYGSALSELRNNFKKMAK